MGRIKNGNHFYANGFHFCQIPPEFVRISARQI